MTFRAVRKILLHSPPARAITFPHCQKSPIALTTVHYSMACITSSVSSALTTVHYSMACITSSVSSALTTVHYSMACITSSGSSAELEVMDIAVARCCSAHP